jgi:ketosteroid isomerase-like protein
LTQAIQCSECGYLQKPGKTCRNLECKKDIQKIKNPLAGLRFHDLRHTAISALGEAGVPDGVIMDIAGHLHPRMLRRYSHIQLESKRAAIQSLSNRPKFTASEDANVTKHVTKEGEAEVIPMQVVEKNGRPVRTRTADLYRVKGQLTNTLNNLDRVGWRENTPKCA